MGACPSYDIHVIVLCPVVHEWVCQLMNIDNSNAPADVAQYYGMTAHILFTMFFNLCAHMRGRPGTEAINIYMSNSYMYVHVRGIEMIMYTPCC